MLATDFYEGTTGGDATDATLIEAGVADANTASGAVTLTGDAELAAYLQAQYDAGAAAGDHVFLRLNAEGEQSNSRWWEWHTANAAAGVRPELILNSPGDGGDCGIAQPHPDGSGSPHTSAVCEEDSFGPGGSGDQVAAPPSTSDAVVERTLLTPGWAGDGGIRLGDNGGGDDDARLEVEQVAVFPFALPAAPAGGAVEGAEASFHLKDVGWQPRGEVDLYGLGHRGSPAVRPTDFYEGPAGGDDTDAALVAADVLAGVAEGETFTVSGPALDAYLTDQYAGGAAEGDFVFLRLGDRELQADPGHWTVSSANAPGAADRPVLAFGGADGGPRVLEPGGGFGGPTPQPPRVPGSSVYDDDRAVARWDVVPYQRFDGLFEVGVPAFHGAGVDRVEFSVEGGQWLGVGEMTENPRTGVEEYWATLDADDFADGLVEVRAVAHPDEGEARVLDPLYLYANAGGSLTGGTVHGSPGQDLLDLVQAAGDGGTVKLSSGVYTDYRQPVHTDPSPGYEQFVTITAADGVAPEDVVIRLEGNTRTKLARLRLKDLTLDTSGDGIDVRNYGRQAVAWLDGVTKTNPVDGPYQHLNQEGNVGSTGNAGGLLVATDSTAITTPQGFPGFDFVRGSHVEDISSDAYQNVPLVIDSTVGPYERRDPAHHPDLFQYFGGNHENVIVYGVEANGFDAQGIFVQYAGGDYGPDDYSMRDSAFVDITLRPVDGIVAKSQLSGRMRHVLFSNVDFGNQSFALRDDWTPDQQQNNGKKLFEAQDLLFEDLTVNQSTYDRLTGDLPDRIELRGDLDIFAG